MSPFQAGLTVDTQQSSAIYGGGALFLLKDGHGSTRMLVDATGQPLSGQIYRYDAFGDRLDTANALTLLLYNTEQSDPTGLDYFRSRYYRPGTGTFISYDSYRGDLYDPLSLHKLLFCRDNGVNGRDPSGHDMIGTLSTISIGATIGAMIGATIGAVRERTLSAAYQYGLYGAAAGAVAGLFPGPSLWALGWGGKFGLTATSIYTALNLGFFAVNWWNDTRATETGLGGADITQ